MANIVSIDLDTLEATWKKEVERLKIHHWFGEGVINDALETSVISAHRAALIDEINNEPEVLLEFEISKKD